MIRAGVVVTALAASGLLVLALAACTSPQPEIEPALDRPTFVWIYSDP